MCGIAGYVGSRQAPEILLNILQRLEYRGYDSAGMAMHSVTNKGISYWHQVGKVSELERSFISNPDSGTCGIAHTRWATHGQPAVENCHPFIGGKDGREAVAVVHNGIIENHEQLRDFLTGEGYHFISRTDSEVIAHLIDYRLQCHTPDPDQAVRETLSRLKGSYALAILLTDSPQTIIVARSGSPIAIGIGQDEYFLSSDPTSLASYVGQVAHLQDGDAVKVSPDRIEYICRTGRAPTLLYQDIDETMKQAADKGNFPHFMLKEIYEQPFTLQNALHDRLDETHGTAQFPDLDFDLSYVRTVKRIVATACGTSWHACLIGRILIRELAQTPVDVEYASEFRYDPSLLGDDDLILAVSQSGETADTLGAIRECQRRGYPILAICNAPGSTMAREATGTLYLHAGPEIGVASTKAFTSQVMALTLFALYLGRLHHLSLSRGQEIVEQLQTIPDIVKRTLDCDEIVLTVAQKYARTKNALYLGRHYNLALALEGALKLKEISYIHAEGYPAAEIKHGPIALVDAEMPSVFIMPPPGFMHQKIMNNVAQIKARGGRVIAIACEHDKEITQAADDVIRVPNVPEYLQPLVNVIPLQLLAYHLAVINGRDVDQPRNLAKSVTVE